MPEASLRGPVDGVPASLMPAAHALIDAAEHARRHAGQVVATARIIRRTA